MSERLPTVVDLFCGAGGLSEGLQQAGFRTICGVDIDRHAMTSFRRNHPNAIAIEEDIASITGQDILAKTDEFEIDLVAGGPSCQGFSTHGKRKQEDPRNFLFRHFIRIVGDLLPKYVLLENVKGLLTYRHGYFRNLIIDSIQALGYSVEVAVLLAADYGVPQYRERIIFLGSRNDVCVASMPKPTHFKPVDESRGKRIRSHVTVREALSDLPLIGTEWDRTDWVYRHPPTNAYQRYCRQNAGTSVTLHRGSPPSKNALEIITRVPQGGGLRSIPESELPDRFKKMRRISDGSLRRDCTTLYHRLSEDKPAYTITCHFRNVASGPFVHPIENRSLSPREAARLMSFRDSYEFLGASLPRQIGNAVPPLLAAALGKSLLAAVAQSVPVRRKKRQRAQSVLAFAP